MKLFLILCIIILAAALATIIVRTVSDARRLEKEAFEKSRDRGEALFLYFQNLEAAAFAEQLDNKIIPIEVDAAS